MYMILAVAIGGALGSLARHFTISGAAGLWGQNFPYGTLIVNVIGSFVIGAIMETFALKFNPPPQEIRAFLVTGILGGFTTFSSFSFDVLKLVDTNHYLPALVYVLLSVGLSLTAVFAAVHLMRGVFA
jgi:CrcB protein